MQFDNKSAMKKFAAIKREFGPQTKKGYPDLYESDVVLNITDWEDGFIEIMLEDGRTYYRMAYTDLERAITASRIMKIE